MPYECSAEQGLEPFPVPLGAYHGMNADESSASFYILSEGHSLFIGIEHVVVGAGEDQQ